MDEGKISQFTGRSAAAIAKEAVFCLNLLEERFGIRFSFKKMSFGDDFATLSFDCGLVRQDNSVISAFEVAFRKHAALYGFSLSDFGRTFTHGGRLYKLAGLNRRNKRRPVVCELVGSSIKVSLSIKDVLKALQPNFSGAITSINL